MESRKTTQGGSAGKAGVFWDIENCPPPAEMETGQVVEHIRTFVSNTYDKVPEITAFGSNESLLPFHTVLGQANVTVKGVNIDQWAVGPTQKDKKKDAADRRLMVEMFSFALDNNEFRRETVIVLISNDIDFFHTLDTLTKKGFDTALLHDVQVSSELLQVVKRHEPWRELARGIGLRGLGSRSHGSRSHGSRSQGSPSHGSPSHRSPSHGSPSRASPSRGSGSYGNSSPRSSLSPLDRAKWTVKISSVISSLRKHRFLPDEGYVRAQLRLEGIAKESTWKSVESLVRQQLREDEQKKTYTGRMHTPRNPSKENFTKEELEALYEFLLDHPLAKKKGQFQMALYIQRQSKVEERSKVNQMPLGMLCEYVALAKEHGWINATGSLLEISDALLMEDFSEESNDEEFCLPSDDEDLNDVEDDEFGTDTQFPPPPFMNTERKHEDAQEEYAPGLSPLMSEPGSRSKTRGVKRNFDPAQAKGLLQYYFQVKGLGLPEYSSKSSGAHHTLSWESSVRVPLTDTGKQFFAMGKHEKKKEAEKAAAFRACTILFNSYLPDFQVPAQYIV